MTSAVINGNLEGVSQAIELLQSLSVAQYTHNDDPGVDSSIGVHMRHVLDLYRALIATRSEPLVDYDQRRRGDGVERSPGEAIDEFRQIAAWLNDLSDEALTQPLVVSTQVLLADQSVARVPSSMLRELIFVACHTVHHFAIIRNIARSSSLTLPDYFGLAPQTANFLRLQH